MASIAIEWRPVAGIPGGPGHLYLVYRDDNDLDQEDWKAISGGPEYPGETGSGEYGRLMSGYKLRTSETPNTAGQVLNATIDRYETGDSASTRGSTVLLSGTDAELQATWFRMVSVANKIFAREYTYLHWRRRSSSL